MERKYNINNNIVYSCKYHVVFCPKYRRKLLVGNLEIRLKELIANVCKNNHIDLLELEVMPDHVHMLIDVDPQFGVNKAIKLIKGTTSRILRKEFPYLKTKVPTLWTGSYFIATVGGVTMDRVKEYIEKQKTSQRQKDKMG